MPKKECDIIVVRPGGTFGVARTTLNSNEYDPEKVTGEYATLTEAITKHEFHANGWKLHPDAAAYR